MRILLVEDNDYLRENILELLEGPGREVVACASAELATAEMRRQPVDVLMTDVSLTGQSGVELARAVLREDPAKWIVFCSGYAFSPGLRALGPNVRSLAKPFELDDLDGLLDDIASRLAASRGAPAL